MKQQLTINNEDDITKLLNLISSLKQKCTLNIQIKNEQLDRKQQTLKEYKFKDPSLEQEAFMHKTFAQQNNFDISNQRLEFLGDSVFSLIVSNYIMEKYTEYPEGQLSKIKDATINAKQQAKFCLQLQLDKRIKFGNGVNNILSNESVLSDVFESYIGAIFQDSSYDTINRLCLAFLAEQAYDPESFISNFNYKGKIFEYFQKWCSETNVSNKNGLLFTWINKDEIESSINAKQQQLEFKMRITIPLLNVNEIGKGANKKIAEEKAAQNACKFLKI